MIRKWNKFKLYLRERLRIISKIEVTYQGKYMVKRRKYDDFIYTKNFENKLELKAKKELERIRNEPNLDSLKLTELEQYRNNLIKTQNEEKMSETNNKILVQGVQKYATFVTIKVHEMFSKNFPEFNIHPEVKINLEKLEYHLNYNIPIDKKIIFETVPELFLYEIGQLDRDERLRYSNRRISFEPAGGIITRDIQQQNYLLNKYDTLSKIKEMEIYLAHNLKDWTNRFAPFIQRKLDEGYSNAFEYWKLVQIKDDKNMTFIERLMLKEFKEHMNILEDINALKYAYENREIPLQMPFPLEGKLKDELLRLSNHISKYEMFDIDDSVLIPRAVPEETFDDRLKKIQGFDVEELKRQSQQEYNFIANQNKPMKRIDLNNKNMDLIKRVNIVSSAIKVQEPKLYTSNFEYELPADYLEETLLGDMPTSGRILVEEYFKVLYLNNENPEKYNFSYWENYFKVDNKTLRNIFNYVFFPLPDEKNKEETGKILYFQDFEFSKRRKLISDMSPEEYNEYLEKTVERPELEETKRLDYIDYQLNSTEPKITERTLAYEDEEWDKQLENPLKYSPFIKEIDERIMKLTNTQINVQHLDKDIVNKIEHNKKNLIEDKKEE